MVFGIFENKVDDVSKATDIIRDYLQKQSGDLGLIMFRIEKVTPNKKENVWYVDCSLFTNLGATRRSFYHAKVNIATGKIEEIIKSDLPRG